MERKIKGVLKRAKGPLSQSEIASLVGKVNRAVLLGYLRALVDLGVIKSRDVGKAKAYYL